MFNKRSCHFVFLMEINDDNFHVPYIRGQVNLIINHRVSLQACRNRGSWRGGRGSVPHPTPRPPQIFARSYFYELKKIVLK